MRQRAYPLRLQRGESSEIDALVRRALLLARSTIHGDLMTPPSQFRKEDRQEGLITAISRGDRSSPIDADVDGSPYLCGCRPATAPLPPLGCTSDSRTVDASSVPVTATSGLPSSLRARRSLRGLLLYTYPKAFNPSSCIRLSSSWSSARDPFCRTTTTPASA